MEKKGVPNIDHLDCYNKEGDVVYLSPKGLQVVPKNQQELFEAIVCVLEALAVSSMSAIFRWIYYLFFYIVSTGFHDDNDTIYHRDIRWDNIVRQHNDPSKWFLIDSTTRFSLS